MKLSVAVCTWNRAWLLRQTLGQFTKLKPADDVEWELVVIDNNSKDSTVKVVKSYEKILPIRYIMEPRQGLSHARNRAIDEAEGEYILWTDDDVLVDESWLVEYAFGIRKYPDAAFFGGPIIPLFEVPPPKWIIQHIDIFKDAFACRDISERELIIRHSSDFPYGANMAVKKSAYENVRYDALMGRRGSDLISGEETALFGKLVQDGLHGVWLPSAKVNHFVPKERISRRYVRKYFQGYGATLARLQEREAEGWVFFLGAPRWLWPLVVVSCLRWWRSVLKGLPDKELRWRELQVDVGQIKEYRRRFHESRVARKDSDGH